MSDIFEKNSLLSLNETDPFEEENEKNSKKNMSINSYKSEKNKYEEGEILENEEEKRKDNKKKEENLEDDPFGPIIKRTKEEEEELNKLIKKRYEKLIEMERIKNEKFLNKKRINLSKEEKLTLNSNEKNSANTSEEVQILNSNNQISKLKNELKGEPKKKVISISNSICNSQEKDDFSTLSSSAIKKITLKKNENEHYNRLYFDIEKERKKLEEMILDIQEKQNNKKDYLKILYDKHNEQIDLKKCYKFNDIYETIDKMDVETLQLGTFYYTYLVGKIIQNAENNILYTDTIQKKLVIRKKSEK